MNMNLPIIDQPDLIEITIDGQTVVVPADTTIQEARIIVENAANAGTQNIALEDWDYTRMLEASYRKHDLIVNLDISSTPAITVSTAGGAEIFACESTTDLHKYLRQLDTPVKEASNG